MDRPVATQRLQVGAAADLEAVWTDQHGERAAASGAVTVRVQTADGTDVVAAGSATTGTNPYVRQLTAAQNTQPELFTATWTAAGDGTIRTTLVETVRAFYFSLADARAFDPKALSVNRHGDSARMRDVRREVEEECERITGTAWVPRYRRVTLDGTGEQELVLPDQAPRSVRSVRVYASASTYTAFTATELAALRLLSDGRIVRTDGSIFPAGAQNLVIEYEHGLDRPPEELRHATLTRFRHRLNMERSVDGAAAARFVQTEGGVLDIPDDLEIEQRSVLRTYFRHARRSRFASRSMDYDPQRSSVFHGGDR